jgi:hypothetical protein
MTEALRFAFLACTASTSELRGGQGSLDRDAIRERLAQPDAGFSILDLDARDDLAAQIEEALAAHSAPPQAALLYVSARATRADGELVLLLDPEHPDTGDALTDIVESLREGVAGEVAAFLDLRVDLDADDLEPMEIARLGRQAAGDDVAEVVVAVRRLSEQDETNAESCSPFTRALLEALDAADPTSGATAAELYAAAREHASVLGVVAALAHRGPEASFEVLFPSAEAPVSDSDADSDSDSDSAPDPARAPVPFRPSPPVPRAPRRCPERG